MRRGKRAGRQVIGCKLATGIEAEPAEPKHRCAKSRIGKVVWPHIGLAETQTLPDQ
jgi:hypothetical protein